MFSIDLLKGQGLPQKFDAKKSALKAVPILIPLIAMTVFGVSYQADRANMQARRKALKSNQQQMEQYTKDVIEYNKIDTDIKGMEKCLRDISKALSYRIQVSSVLVELVGALPENIFLYEMKMDRTPIRQKIQQEGAAVVKQRLIVRRQLKLVLCGFFSEQSDISVQEYVTRLEKSALLSDIFTEIKPPARGQGEVEGRNAIFYEIDCVLQEQG